MNFIKWNIPALFNSVDSLLEKYKVIRNSNVSIPQQPDLTAGISLSIDQMPKRYELETPEQYNEFISKFQPNQSFQAGGQLIAMYIEDHTGAMPHNDPSKLHKVHITNCGALTTAQTSNRYARFVVMKSPNGIFPVWFSGYSRGTRIQKDASLLICKMCRDNVNQIKKGTVSKFNLQSSNGQNVDWKGLEEFIISGSTDQGLSQIKILNNKAAGTTSGDKYGYVANWAEISLSYRASLNWKCECCNIGFSDNRNRHLLHTHHIDLNKQNNMTYNFKALCVICHSNQPNHGHMYEDSSYGANLRAIKALGLNTNHVCC